MSAVNSDVTAPNFTKFSHDIEASFGLLLRSARLHHDVTIRFLALVQQMQVESVGIDNVFATLFGCHGNGP